MLPSLFNWMMPLRWPHVEGIEEESSLRGEQPGSTSNRAYFYQDWITTLLGRRQTRYCTGGEGFVLCLSGVMDICSLCSLYSVLLMSKVSSKGK